jgi:chorismate synthase
MSGNSRGERFRVTTFGESHGGGVGVVIDGCPAGVPFPLEEIAAQLARRRPGQSHLSTQRKEDDVPELLSGVCPQTGATLGTPITLVVRNKDARSDHYKDMAKLYRPSHADYTYEARFGLRAPSGGGRASARETVGRVAAGALAQALLQRAHGIEIIAWVDQVADVYAGGVDEDMVTRDEVDATVVRCPDPDAAAAMEATIVAARKAGDSVGGAIRCVARGVPPGWGAPVFDKITADLAGALMSLPATRGVEFGEGFAATTMRGSTHNDAFTTSDGTIVTATNRSGGVQGGITTGAPLRMRVGFKPVATIFQPQQTVTSEGEEVTFQPAKGRHDPCVLPRAVPMVEAMVALVLADQMLRSLGAREADLRVSP